MAPTSSRVRRANKASTGKASFFRKSSRRSIQATASQLLSTVADVFDPEDLRYQPLNSSIRTDAYFIFEPISRYSAQVSTSSELSDIDKEGIWDLFEQNMRHMYDRSLMPVQAITPYQRENITAGMPNLPWGGIHHQKRRSSSTAILAS